MTRILTIIAFLFATPAMAKPNDLTYDGEGGYGFITLIFLVLMIVGYFIEKSQKQGVENYNKMKEKEAELQEKQKEIEALQAEVRASKKGKETSSGDDDCVFPF